jgi:hypothetical protein
VSLTSYGNLVLFLNLKTVDLTTVCLLENETYSLSKRLSKLGDGALSSIVSGKNVFQAYVMSKPKIGLAIAWALNLDIGTLIFFWIGVT